MRGLLLQHHNVVGPWVAKRCGGSWQEGRGTTIGLVHRDHGLIAGCLFEDFNGVNINLHIAATPGTPWLTRQFLWACFSYPFEELGAKRITGIVPASNHQARRFDEHLGFVLEATLQDAHPDGDMLLYVMWKQDCRWLSLGKDRHVEKRSQT